MNLTDFAPPEARLRSIELFAEKVIPEFRGQLRPPLESREWVLGQKAGDEGTKWKQQTMDAITAASQQYEAERAAGAASPVGT